VRCRPSSFRICCSARERGLPERAEFILTGYIGSLDVALMVADFVAEAKP